MLARRFRLIGFFGALVAIACGDSEGDSGSPKPDGGAGTTAGSGGSGAEGGNAGSTTGGSGGVAGSGNASGTGGAAGSVLGIAGCSAEPPPGAPQAADPPTYAGTCPTLAAGANTINSQGNDRSFLLAVPATIDPQKPLPVIFLWHWLGGDANDFYTKGEVQAAVDSQHFIAVLPEKKGDLLFTWPVENFQSQARVDEELALFDDVYACVAAQFNINKNCVSSVGVSAGALWTAQVASQRDQYLSSFISLSGGVGGVIKPWGNPSHKLPAIVLWGGSNDTCVVINFETLSKSLEDELTQDGHFFLECVHNCGHSEPPFEGPAGFSKYKALWDFVFDHPYWLPAGSSPYATSGVPADLPSWCAIGAGNAVPKTGACEGGSGC